MKIKKLSLSNFAKFTEFEADFNGDITRLVGLNGSGKTTVGLTAIWAGIKGIAEKNKDGQLIGERFRFIGNSKPTADIEIVVYDEKTGTEVTVKNHITKASNVITCEPVQSKEWLGELLNVAFLSAKNFSQLDPRQQAIELGIDTIKFDNELKEAKEEYTVINRQIRAMGEVRKVDKVDRVSISNLIAKRSQIESENREAQETHRTKHQTEERLNDLTGLESELVERLKVVREKIKVSKETLSRIELKPMRDTSDIDDQIYQAEETNQKADSYERAKKQMDARNELEKQVDENKALQESIIKKRMEYIKKYDFGFDGLDVDERGGLLLDGRPLKDPYYSKGELELIVAKLYASTNPKLKVRFIDDLESLDTENQKKILEHLLKEGFQVIAAEVGEEKKDGNTILLRECQVSDKPKKDKLI